MTGLMKAVLEDFLGTGQAMGGRHRISISSETYGSISELLRGYFQGLQKSQVTSNEVKYQQTAPSSYRVKQSFCSKVPLRPVG